MSYISPLIVCCFQSVSLAGSMRLLISEPMDKESQSRDNPTREVLTPARRPFHFEDSQDREWSPISIKRARISVPLDDKLESDSVQLESDSVLSESESEWESGTGSKLEPEAGETMLADGKPLYYEWKTIRIRHPASDFEKAADVAAEGWVILPVTVSTDGSERMRDLIDEVNDILSARYSEFILATFGTRNLGFHFVERIVVLSGGRFRTFTKDQGGDEDPVAILDASDGDQQWLALTGWGPLPGQADLIVSSDMIGGGQEIKLTVDNSDSLLELKKAVCVMYDGRLPVRSIMLFAGSAPFKHLTDDTSLSSVPLSKVRPELRLVISTKSGHGTRMKPTLLDAVARLRNQSIANQINPALKLVTPCQLENLFQDFIHRGFTSELHRLARLVWKHASAAVTMGHVSRAFFALWQTPGANVNEKVHNYVIAGPMSSDSNKQRAL